ncbi:HlyD family efflux transporter periplasmic adaptor subunit [Magnetococcus sp. PR-3]|uniref:HlyD family efflux transporter periplasmic adaptor subunit n=1 Tax=Magnetococcus sp. PR-3 TaxID=3120355 RepID=UPI002FCE2FC6
MLPKLRDDLRLYEAARFHDGSPSWTIQDPVTNRFIAIGWLEFELLSRWHLGSAEAIIEATNTQTPLLVSPQELDALVAFLNGQQLTRIEGPEHTDELIKNYEKSKYSRLKNLLHHYLFFRIPLWRPSGWLEQHLKGVQWLYSRAVAYLLIGLGVVALYMTMQQLDLFAASFVDTLSAQGVMGYLGALVLTKSLHELGHAFTATRYGVRVAHMGFAFLVLWPVLYTDTSESWRLKEHDKRLAIASAGIVAELALAVLALLAWNWAQPGVWRDAFFFLATTAWVLSLVINASPFMRFDGYYILADVLEMPNLHQRAGAMAQMWLRNNLLGWDEPLPETVTRSRRRFLVLFAFLTWLYRFVMFIGIAIAVYYFFFKALGIFLFIVEIWWFVWRPIAGEVKVWYGRRGEISMAGRLKLLALLGGLLAIGGLPWDRQVSAPAWLHAAQSQVLYSPVPAQLVAQHALPGPVQAGELLFTLAQPDSQMRSAKASAGKKALEHELVGLMGLPKGEEKRSRLQEMWQVRNAEQQAETEQSQRLHLKAPYAGQVTDIDPLLTPGVWVKPDQPLAVVMNPTTWVAEAFVSQQALQRIEVGNRVRFYTQASPLHPLLGAVVELDSQRVTQLPETLLSSKHGGDLAVEADADGLTPKETLFRVRIALQTAPPMAQIGMGEAVIEAKSTIPFIDTLRSVAVVLVRESTF